MSALWSCKDSKRFFKEPLVSFAIKNQVHIFNRFEVSRIRKLRIITTKQEINFKMRAVMRVTSCRARFINDSPLIIPKLIEICVHSFLGPKSSDWQIAEQSKLQINCPVHLTLRLETPDRVSLKI